MMGLGNRTAEKPGDSKTALSEFIPQRRNANRHTERGMGLLEKSIRTDGYSTPMVAAADGEIFDGSARIEKVGELMAGAEPIVVHSDGTRPVIHVRDDIPSASDPRAVRLAVAANRIAQVNLDWDIPLLESLPEITAELWSADELATLLDQPIDNNGREQGGDASQGITEQYLVVVTCPNEQAQLELIERMQAEGLQCKALIS